MTILDPKTGQTVTIDTKPRWSDDSNGARS
jgi:hypothetical protein